MKYKYIGEKDSESQYGIEFKNGEAVEVDPKQVAYTVKLNTPKKVVTALVVDKLDSNPFYEKVKAKPGPKPKNDNTSRDTQPGTE